MYRTPRSFSTSARVHPSFLPHLRHSRRMPFRWPKTLVALFVGGYAVKMYLDRASAPRRAQAERDDNELRRRNNALMDVYGDRSSLGELERAVQHYEKGR